MSRPRVILPLLSWLALIGIFAAACNSSSGISTGISGTSGAPVPVTATAGSGWYDVCFTNPGSAEARTLRGGCDDALAQSIRNARVSVDAAIYELDLWSIRNALVEAHKKGVTVRVVTESDYLENAEMQDLIAAGIKVVDDRKDGLMHNKFIVIDRQEVWTGSMNFTINGAYKNDNNLLRLRSTKLAQDYIAEFEEMFLEKKFGADSPANTPYPAFTQDGTLLEVYFSPDDGIQRRLVELIAAAQQSIDFLAFSFTSDEIAAAMLERAAAGVKVQGVMERRQYESNAGTEFDTFSNAGLDVRLDGSSGMMHHKVILIDRKIVISGSYNFSFNAESRNDENLLIFHSPDLAAFFLQEFGRVFAEAVK